MQHKRRIGRLLAGVLAALTFAIVGLATPALAADSGDTPETAITWDTLVLNDQVTNTGTVYVKAGATDATEQATFKGSNLNLIVLGTDGSIKLPQITVGDGKNPASLNLTFEDVDSSTAITSVEFGGITVSQEGTLAVNASSSGLSTMTMTSGANFKVNAGGVASINTEATEGLNWTLDEANTGGENLLAGSSSSSVNGSALTLGSDVTLTFAANLSVPAGQAGSTAAATGKGATLTIQKGATLNLGEKNLTIAASEPAKGQIAGTSGILTVNGAIKSANTSTIENAGTLDITGSIGDSDYAIPITNTGSMTTSGVLNGTVTTGKTGTNPKDTTSSLTVNGGSITGGSGKRGVTANGGTVKITAGDITGTNSSAFALPADGTATVTISGGNLISSGGAAGLYFEDGTAGTVAINGNGVSITAGGNGVSMNSGTLTISNPCTINAGTSSNSIHMVGGSINISSTITMSNPSTLVNVSKGVLTLSNGANLSSSSASTIVSISGTGELVMTGGTISNTNKAANSVGVSISDGAITMSGDAHIYGDQYGLSVSGSDNSVNIQASGSAVIGTTGTNASDYAIYVAPDTPKGQITLSGQSSLDFDPNAGPINSDANIGTGKVVVRASRSYNLGYNDYEEFQAGFPKALQDQVTIIDHDAVGPGGNPTPPGPEPEVKQVTVTYNYNNGTTAETQTLDLEDGSTTTSPRTTRPTYAGHVFLGWYDGDNRVASFPQTITTNKTYNARWASMQVTLTKAEQAVNVGTDTATIALATTTTPAETTGFGSPSITVTPSGVGYKLQNNTITLNNLPDEPANVTVTVSYLGATSSTAGGSGYASATVHVVNAGNVTVASNSATMGAVAKVLNDNGTLTLTATPNPGYVFTQWQVTGTTPENIDLTDNPLTLDPTATATTWTAQFQAAKTVTVYRYYNPWLAGAHLFTADPTEMAQLEADGWVPEGAKFTEYADAASGGQPVYRLYNPNNGDHFFTDSTVERDTMQHNGWTYENVAWYGAVTTTTPVFRLYNPWMTANAGLGNHLWTTSTNERSVLVGLGWRPEGTGWYAVSAL